jgi:methyl-accepting chemotaxis protein
MQAEYRMNLRDWLSQIKVRLIALMFATVSLPILSGLAWDYWTDGSGWRASSLISALVGGLCLIAGIREALRVGRRATAVGFAADTFAGRGKLGQKVSSRGRDELAWTAYSFNRMMKRLREIADLAERAATGDLSIEIEARSEDDRLAHSLNTMIANLRQLIGQVVDNANTLSAASNQLASTTDQAREATQQIAVTMQQVARGAAQQTESAVKVARSETLLSQSIDGVAQGTREQAVAVTRISEIVAQITGDIKQLMENARQLETVKEMVRFSAVKVLDIGERANQIGAIVEIIGDISAQTNLLALNAAVEAKRAGEHGKGFGVVSAGVRELAGWSGAATKEIAGLIKGVQKALGETVVAVGDSATGVEYQVEQLSKATQQMDTLSHELAGAMNAVSAVVERNTTGVEEMAASSEEVSRAIGRVAGISEENGAATEEVSATVEEMSAQMDELTASAQSLAEMAQVMRHTVARFRLSAADVHPHAPGIAPPKASETRADTETDRSSPTIAPGATR